MFVFVPNFFHAQTPTAISSGLEIAKVSISDIYFSESEHKLRINQVKITLKITKK